MTLRLWSVSCAAALVAGVVWGQGKPVELRYSVMDGNATIGVVRQTVADFEKANPDVKIKVEQVSDEFNMRLLTQYAAGVAPDMAQMNVSMYQAFAMRGALVDLRPFIAKSPDVDLAKWYLNIVQFFTWDGKLWGLPKDVSPFGLVFYNKTLFDRAGVPYPDPHWTWSYAPRPDLKSKDFTWTMQQMTAKDGAGKTQRWGFAPDWPQLYFYLLLQSRGLKLWDDSTAPRRIVADDPQIVELMDFANQTINKHNWVPTWDQIDTVARSTVYDEFVKGRVAMVLTFASKLGQLRTDMARMGWDWDVTLFPAFEGKPLVTGTDGSATVIFSTSKHKDAAWRFAKWMSGEPGQRLAAKAGSQPARRDLALEPGVWLPGSATPAENRQPANLAVTDQAALSMVFEQTPEYFEDTRLNLDNTAFDILSGSRPPRETLLRVTKESQTRLDAALRQMPKDPFPFGLAIGVVVLAVGSLLAWLVWPDRGLKLSNSERKESRSAYKFLAPLLIGLSVFTLGPILASLLLSFSNSDIVRPPLWRGIGNYVDAITVDPVFWSSVRVSAVYALLSVPLSLVVAISLALLLNQKVRGVPLFRAMYYIPSLVSGVATSLIWMRVFNPQNGILNTLIYGSDGHGNTLGIGALLSNLAGTPGQPVNWLGNEHTVLPAFVLVGLWGAGGGTIIFLAGLQGVPQMYYDAATVDGTNSWGKFRHVTMPLLSPTVFFALVTGCIGALQSFTQSFVMTGGGPNNATMFYMLNLYIQGFKSLKMGYACALAWILFAAILLLTGLNFAASKRWVYYEGEAK